MTSWLRRWLRADSTAASDGGQRPGALDALVDALEHLPPDRARYLAQFAYLLGRVAHADEHIAPDEQRAMEMLISREAGLSGDQAALVVGLARESSRLFGATDNFLVAREFAAETTYEQKLALVRCLFVVSSAEGRISVDEEREIRRVARELRIDPADIVQLRLQYRDHLPGLSTRRDA
jgi:uncharacterized tellurite resistance protein B-like protein